MKRICKIVGKCDYGSRVNQGAEDDMELRVPYHPQQQMQIGETETILKCPPTPTLKKDRGRRNHLKTWSHLDDRIIGNQQNSQVSAGILKRLTVT